MNDTTEVFAKVLQSLAMFARSDNGVWPVDDLTTPILEYPFVCERGDVVGDVRMSARVHQLRETALLCPAHSYVRYPEAKAAGFNKQVCKWHPVVDPGLVAAHLVGGSEAVAAMRGKFDRLLWAVWDGMIERFVEAVVAYDRGLESDDPQCLAPSGNHVSFDGGVGWLEKFTVKLRPGARRRRRKREV